MNYCEHITQPWCEAIDEARDGISTPNFLISWILLNQHVGGNTDNVTIFLECNLKLASTTEFHVECNSLHYNETAKYCGVISLLPAGC